MSLSTQDCKDFLETAELPAVARIAEFFNTAAEIELGPWVRAKKYKTPEGLVARDFVNKTIPVFVTIVENDGALKVARDRPVFMWEENLFAPYENLMDKLDEEDEDLIDEFHTIVWNYAEPSDFRFAIVDDNYEPTENFDKVVVDEDGDDDEGYRYVFGFHNDSSYDRCLQIEEVLKRHKSKLNLWESSEQCYAQSSDGHPFTPAEAREELIRLGFVYDLKFFEN